MSASAFLRLHKDDILTVKSDISDQTIPKLPIRLIQSTQDNKWPLENWGVLGLAPKGDFFTYLAGLYDEESNISLALKYTILNKDDPNEKLNFETQMILNPKEDLHYSEEDIVGEYNIDTTSRNNWSIIGSLELENTELKYNKQHLCLDTFTNELFGIIDGDVWCQQIRMLVCGVETNENCFQSHADLSKAADILITIGDDMITLSHEDYIYFDHEGLQCRIGDPSIARSQGTCSQDTEVVLGKLFMTKYIPILKLDTKTGQFKMILTNVFKIPNQNSIIWLILASTMAGLSLVGLLFIIFSPFKNRSYEDYVRA